jgi:hypothetical protein
MLLFKTLASPTQLDISTLATVAMGFYDVANCGLLYIRAKSLFRTDFDEALSADYNHVFSSKAPYLLDFTSLHWLADSGMPP